MAYAVTTRATLRQRVRERLLTNWWLDEELNNYINEALRIWGVLTGFYRQRSTVTFTSGQTDYDVTVVDAECLAVLRIEGQAGPHLDPAQLMSVGYFNPTWQSDTSTIPYRWIPLGLNKLALYPRLTSGYAAYVDNLYYSPVPATDADYIQVGEEDMAAIIDYIEYIASIKEGGSEMTTSTGLLASFTKQAAANNSRLRKSAIFRNALGMADKGQQDTRPKDLEGLAPR